MQDAARRRGWRRRRDVAAAVLVLLVAALVATAAVVKVSRATTTTGDGTTPAAAATGPVPTPSLAAARPVSPHELLSGDAAGFDGGTGGWTGSQVALATTPAPTQRGAGALSVTDLDPVGGAVEVWSPARPARSGDRYVGTAAVRAVTAGRGVAATLRFLSSGGTVTDVETGQPTVDSLTDWSQLPAVVALAPKGARSVEVGVDLPVVGPTAHHLVDDVTLQQTPGPAPAVVGPLSVVGTSIVDGRGRPLVLRGIQRFGLEGGTNNPLPTAAEIGQLKAWGANEVRISLGEQKWLSSSCHFVPDYEQTVDRVVHDVTSRGMVALVNLHFSTVTSCGTPGLTPMADSPGSLTFWQEVATRYRDDPLVAFDLFNEPTVSSSVWLNGGTVRFGHTVFRAAGMQQLYDDVRSVGATNLVVISGLSTASLPPHDLVAGADIVYGLHAYTCPQRPPPGCGARSPYDADALLRPWDDFATRNAVMVTEFGWPQADNGTYNAALIAAAEHRHWGWSGFAWDGSATGTFDLIQAKRASDGTTYEPSPAGMPLLAGLAMNVSAGDGTSSP